MLLSLAVTGPLKHTAQLSRLGRAQFCCVQEGAVRAVGVPVLQITVGMSVIDLQKREAQCCCCSVAI